MTRALPTSLVGSYPQPEWLIDRGGWQAGAACARRRSVAVGRRSGSRRRRTTRLLLAIRDQERAGLDVITDGEQRRESYSNRFAAALDGIDADNPGTTLSRNGKSIPVPRVVGPIRRTRPVELRDLEVLRANTGRASRRRCRALSP